MLCRQGFSYGLARAVTAMDRDTASPVGRRRRLSRRRRFRTFGGKQLDLFEFSRPEPTSGRSIDAVSRTHEKHIQSI